MAKDYRFDEGVVLDHDAMFDRIASRQTPARSDSRTSLFGSAGGKCIRKDSLTMYDIATEASTSD
jgi:hypothetical protein